MVVFGFVDSAKQIRNRKCSCKLTACLRIPEKNSNDLLGAYSSSRQTEVRIKQEQEAIAWYVKNGHVIYLKCCKCLGDHQQSCSNNRAALIDSNVDCLLEKIEEYIKQKLKY